MAGEPLRLCFDPGADCLADLGPEAEAKRERGNRRRGAARCRRRRYRTGQRRGGRGSASCLPACVRNDQLAIPSLQKQVEAAEQALSSSTSSNPGRTPAAGVGARRPKGSVVVCQQPTGHAIDTHLDGILRPMRLDLGDRASREMPRHGSEWRGRETKVRTKSAGVAPASLGSGAGPGLRLGQPGIRRITEAKSRARAQAGVEGAEPERLLPGMDGLAGHTTARTADSAVWSVPSTLHP